jgi:D-methionine transport system substrate-binding protein
MSAGLNPKKDAIALERADGPYVNILVVRAGDEKQAWASKLVKAYQSPSTREFVEKQFQGSVLLGF